MLDFPAQLAQARPGPNYPCNSTAPSNVAPPFSFAHRRDPLLTPSARADRPDAHSSYSCKFQIGTFNAGEISWDNTTEGAGRERD